MVSLFMIMFPVSFGPPVCSPAPVGTASYNRRTRHPRGQPLCTRGEGPYDPAPLPVNSPRGTFGNLANRLTLPRGLVSSLIEKFVRYIATDDSQATSDLLGRGARSRWDRLFEEPTFYGQAVRGMGEILPNFNPLPFIPLPCRILATLRQSRLGG